ncbi:MAG: right-handed parallel beta-helix repeat-containing protein [Deltaproteobacteria bacterium]|nr:right-handed parallel beta-helix repeat-containing protein [Deltaproteobacteria bacterium]
MTRQRRPWLWRSDTLRRCPATGTRLSNWWLVTVAVTLVGCGDEATETVAGDGTPAPPSATSCAEPLQGDVGADWPEVFVGVSSCDDAGSGSREVPFCSFESALDAVPNAPGIVTVLAGDYRLMDQLAADSYRLELARPGSPGAYFVLRADQGAQPRIWGSIAIEGTEFVAAGANLQRASTATLRRNPPGMWTAGGLRLEHHHAPFDAGSGLYHVDVAELSEGEWTMADDGGTACNDVGPDCFVYLWPPAGMDVATERFELAQGGFLNVEGSDYLAVQGLTVEFTYWTPIFFTGSAHLLVEDNRFAHNAAMGGNNAYGLSFWNTQGGVIRRNQVTDTRYWTEANSWGITFMLAGNEAGGEIWVCDNELSDFLRAAVGSKGGASQIRVVGNVMVDSTTAVEVPESRCDGPSCGFRYPTGDWTVRENLIENCGRGFDMGHLGADDVGFVSPNRVHNNVMVGAEHGIAVQIGDPHLTVRNNVFIDTVGFRLGGDPSPGAFVNILDADYNLFPEDIAYEAHQDFQVQGSWTLAEVQASVSQEAHSLSGDPLLDTGARYEPLPGSPVIGAGDPSVYVDPGGPVNMGRYPFVQP